METAAGLMPGTPAYMPPEMALGEPYDGQADLYALGCVGYFLLTGRAVFEADTPLQVIARHLHAKPAPPSERAGAPVPPALEQLVLGCLSKPGARFKPPPWHRAPVRPSGAARHCRPA